MAIDQLEVEGLYDRLAPAIYSLALADSKSEADADDLVQETLLAYLEAKSSGTEIRNPEHWVMRVAANALKRTGRHRRRWHLVKAPPEVIAPGDVAVEVVGTQAPAIKALQRLGKDDRRLIALYRLAGRSDSEVASVLGTSAQNVRQRLGRAWSRLSSIYLEELLGKLPSAAGCLKPRALIPRSIAGTLSDSQRAQLLAHLESCQSCSEARDQLEWYWKEGLTALLPLTPTPQQRRRVVGRLVGMLAVRPSPPADRSNKRRLVLAVWLLVLLLFFVPGLSPSLTFNQPAGLVVEPSPNGVALPSPSSPSLALTSVQPSLAPPPTAGGRPPGTLSPCPVPTPSDGYAYLSGGELYYRTQLGSAPRQLTSTGSRIDAFWWSPDGTRLAYKQQASPPDIAGDIHVISLSSGSQLWHFGSPVDHFAFSPDGARYVAATRVVSGGNWVAENLKVGSFSQPTSAATDWQLPLPALPASPIDFEDQAPHPQSVFSPFDAVFWVGGLIEFAEPTIYSSLDPATGAINSAQPFTQTVETSWLGLNSASRFTYAWSTATVDRLCGKLVAESNLALGGRPALINVSPDGTAALLSLNDGAADLAWLQPDGTVTRLSSNGVSAGGRWRP